MRKLILPILFFFVGLFAYAQTTASIVITGTVAPVISVSITPEAISSNLDLTANITNLKVATVNERSNIPNGYTVSVESANALSTGTSIPYFEGQNATTPETLDYTINYGGSPISLVSGIATITDSNARTTGTGVDKDLAISYNGSTHLLAADTYSDTLTFTITAK